MQKVMGVSGAESLNVAASIFMGQTEAPLTIKPFLAGLTESELFTIMTSGMAHVSGSVMAAYVKIAGVAITHLLTAVIMTAPATIMLAKIFIPETDKPVTAGKVEVKIEKTARQRDRRGGAGRGRRPAPGAERRRHADRVSGADRHVATASSAGCTALPLHGLAAGVAAADLRRGLRAGGVAAGRAVEGRAGHRQPAGHAPGAQRIRGVSASSGR